MAMRKHSGIKVIKAALHHRRGDKYLFANKEGFRGRSYRDLWYASGSKLTFERWLQTEGVDLSQYLRDGIEKQF